MLSILLENATTCLIFLSTILFMWYVLSLPRLRNMPPGPFPLPVVGNLPLLWRPGVTLISLFGELTEKYGKILTFKMGSRPIILINDLKLLRDVYVKRGHVTSDRPDDYYFIQKAKRKVGLGLSLSSGQAWRELRRVSVMALREFGVGKKDQEERVALEVTELLKVIDQTKGQPVDLKHTLMKATSNVVSSFVFGSRFEFDDPRFDLLLSRLREATKVNAFFLPVNFLPFIRFFSNIEDQFLGTIETTSGHIKELLTEHGDSYDPDNIRDFVDLVLQMRSSADDNGRHFNDHNLARAIVDLFGAGSETTASTLQFLLYFMANHRDIQTRCQTHIDQVLGDGRPVQYSDRERLTYVEATVMEVLRLRPVGPFGFPHHVSRDIEVGGYTIPKGAVCFSNILAMGQDPNTFVNPERFDPTRWLDKDGALVGRERLVTFSIGPRSCVGELVARMELFMFFTSILQFYTILPGVPGKPVDLTPSLGFIMKGKEQNLIFQKR